MSAQGPGAQGVQRFPPRRICKRIAQAVGAAYVMVLVDFERADGSILTWHMRRTDTIADVKSDMRQQTGRDCGDLIINNDVLADDKTYHEVVFLLICRSVKEVENYLKNARLEFEKAEASVQAIRWMAVDTMGVDSPSEPGEEGSPLYEPARTRSRSPRARSGGDRRGSRPRPLSPE